MENNNKYELEVYYTSDNEAIALAEIEDMVKECSQITFVSLDVIDSKRACRNAYGKEIGEYEFDDIDADSDEAWFDDYDFTFKLVIETSLSLEDAINVLVDNGVDVNEDI